MRPQITIWNHFTRSKEGRTTSATCSYCSHKLISYGSLLHLLEDHISKCNECPVPIKESILGKVFKCSTSTPATSSSCTDDNSIVLSPQYSDQTGTMATSNKQCDEAADTMSKLEHVKEYLKTGCLPVGWSRTNKFSLKKLSMKYNVCDDHLYYVSSNKKEKRLVLFTKEEQHKAVYDSHIDNISEDHLNLEVTQLKVMQYYYWPDMNNYIIQLLKNCSECLRKKCMLSDPVCEDSNNFANLSMEVESASVRVPEDNIIDTTFTPAPELIQGQAAWEVIYVDILGPLPKTVRGHSYLCCITDMFSHWLVACPIRDKGVQFVGQTVADIIYTHGCPKQICNNLGKLFTKLLTEELHNLLGSRQNIVFVDRPKSQSKVEQPWRKCRQSLLQYVHVNPDDWDVCLPSVTYPHNTTASSSAEMVPYLALYGRLPRDIVGLNINTFPDNNVESLYALYNMSCSYSHIPEIYSAHEEEIEPRSLNQRDTNHRLYQVKEFMKTGEYPAGWGRADKYAMRKFAARFQLIDDTLYYMYPAKASKKKRLVLFTDKDRKLAVTECHIDQVTSVHHGFIRTQKKINDKYYWMEITRDVCEMVKQCPQCAKGCNDPVTGPVHPLQAREVWELLAVDIIGPLPPSSRGNTHILTVTDVYSKYIAIFPMCVKTTRSVANLLVHLIYTHGPPTRILCAHGKQFVKLLNEEMFQVMGTKYSVAVAANAQLGNQEKYLNTSLKKSLLVFVNDNKDDWDNYLSSLSNKINTSLSPDSTCTPYSLMYSRQHRNIDDYEASIAMGDVTSLQYNDDKRGEECKDVNAVCAGHHNYIRDNITSHTSDNGWRSSCCTSTNNQFLHYSYTTQQNFTESKPTSLDSRVTKKIQDLTNNGVTGVKKIELLISNYIKQDLCKGSTHNKLLPTYLQVKYYVNKARSELKKEGRNYIKLQTKAAAKDLLKEIESCNDDKGLGQLKEHLLHLKTALQLGQSLEPLLIKYKEYKEELQDSSFKIKKRKLSRPRPASVEVMEDSSSLSHPPQPQVCQLTIDGDTHSAPSHVMVAAPPHSSTDLMLPPPSPPPHYSTLHNMTQDPSSHPAEVYYIMPDSCS